MLANTGIPTTADRFAATLRTFREHASAVASGRAEGEAFTWFLASEYEWEIEMACTWLVESPESRLTDAEKATLRHFLATMPEVRNAIVTGRQAASNQLRQSGSHKQADWLEITGLPSWNHFTVHTAILLSQLGSPAQNDTRFEG